jgi:hypothetical protein
MITNSYQCYDRKGRHTHSRKVTQPLSRAVMDENCELREALQLRDYFRDLSTARKASLVDLSPIGTPVRTPVRSSPSANSCSVGESSTLGERQRFVDSPQSITPSSGSSVEYPPSSSSPLTTLTGSSPMFTVHSPNASLVYSTSSPNSSPALSDDSPSKRRNPARHARPSSFWFPADTQQNASPITVGSSVISTDDEEFNSSGSDGTRVNELSDSEDDVSFIASIFKPYTNRSPPPCLRDYLYGSANSSPGIPRPTRSILYPETDLVNDVDASPFINNEACDIEIQIEMYLVSFHSLLFKSDLTFLIGRPISRQFTADVLHLFLLLQ